MLSSKKHICVYVYALSMVAMGYLLFLMWAGRMMERDINQSELLLANKRISLLAVLCEDVTPARLEAAASRNSLQFSTCTPDEWSYYDPWEGDPPEGTTLIYYWGGMAFYFNHDELLQIDVDSDKNGPVRFDQRK